MSGNSLRTLEFDQILTLLVQQAGSVDGKARLAGLQPLVDAAAVREALGLTSEAAAVLRVCGRQPHHDLPEIAAHLPVARVTGAHLEPLALLDVASFIEGALEIARSVAAVEAAPRLAHRAASVRDARDVAAAIRRAVLGSGELADDASPKLAETRRALARLRTQLSSVMESLLRGKDADRLLQDKVVTTRNDRYVVLLKAEHRGQIPGIVHGGSGSGASLFVEPLPAVELNNDIVELQDEERREVIRILQELTRRVADRADDLEHAREVMGELDARQAMALLARDMNAVEPEIWAPATPRSGIHSRAAAGASGGRDASAPQPNEGACLELREGRHPLLMPHLAERLGIDRTGRPQPVPLTVRVGFGEPVLVISGPNTGGKTVALKTLGLLAAMAQCGLHVPAAAGTLLPVFHRIHADIGDEQSIAANLSTFSAHLAAIVEMTRELRLPALVLLDEVGAGTDPTEGGALGVAIVDHFRRMGAMVVASTHHGLMKAYAQSTPGVACASFGYDPSTYAPTYRLAQGVPGRSLALEMAERLGLPAAVVADARARRDEKEAQAEALLARLEKGEAELQANQARLDDEKLEIGAARARLELAEREAAARKKTEAEAFARELRRRGDEAARKAADAITAAVRRVEATRRSAAAEGTKARTEAIHSIREAQDEALRGPELDLPNDPATPDLPLAVGGRVRLKGLAVIGEVLSLGEQGAEVAVGGKRLKVSASELVALPAAAERPSKSSYALGTTGGERKPAPSSEASGSLEVVLVGLRVDEAIPRVDKVLDEAAVADRREVRVVHGFGEGKLRRAVAELLEGHPHVAKWRSGGPREGGGGVTIVELKA